MTVVSPSLNAVISVNLYFILETSKFIISNYNIKRVDFYHPVSLTRIFRNSLSIPEMSHDQASSHIPDYKKADLLPTTNSS